MKAKKSKKIDIDKKRGMFFRIGLAISITLVILAFQWTSHETQSAISYSYIDLSDDEIIDITFQKEPEVKAHLVKQVDDNKEIEKDQPDLVETEVDPDEKVAIPDPVNVKVEEEKEVPELVPFYAVEHKPNFPGNDNAMINFLSKNIRYPEIEKENGIQGLVVVSFIVNTDGSLSNVKIKKGLTPNLNNEALRVVNLMPKWNPGKQRNKNVKVPVNIPIRFVLSY